ncbi:sigma-54-dependent transcriptional regulator [Bordetella genomosp. 4]|uniref:Sigma-54-dependent Fis family transcriptional regulator n=1 Tax=Bordetella genomosp. 4 TaxID=463044 RepID=A0A261U3J8_9BORD|nr:sigma-54 dependent transcriptional regulator [Bordetella genomosp. 4]OZI55972.1 sigma-54-dependent Fis family transcriptional regulator [Bordetella genomosp. 4]
MPHLLIVDDDDAVRDTLAEIGKDSGYTVSQASTIKRAVIEWERHVPDLLLLDVRLSEGSGMDLFERVPIGNAEVVVISGHGTMDSAIEALRLGATDYLVKPIEMDRLLRILNRVAGGFGDAENSSQPVKAPGRLGKMLGNSEPMTRLFDQISRAAPSEVTTLLVGESGTGKELAAHALHQLSPRSQKPFVVVNCGAIAPNLIESELFGHERGSFTGADRMHKGYFEQADGGTLFLDEVTEMPLEMQVKLLRVLESGCFVRVGSHQQISCDVRVIAATNRNPEQAVQDGKFREDLYFRLSVFPVDLPALRERGDDILMLADQFLSGLNAEHGTNKTFSEQARQAIQNHTWPGNVRELRNFVRRAFILADGDEVTGDTLIRQASPTDAGKRPTLMRVPVGATLAEADRQLILATLERCQGVRKQTAAVLGISPKTLYNKLEEYAQAGHVVPGGNPAPEDYGKSGH